MPTLSLEQLAALHDEMAALARAGVPLEQGLAELGREAPGAQGRVASKLASRMEAGESLEQALSDPQLGLSPAYRAVVLAGLRSGRLAESFEHIAESARRRVELGRSLRLTMLYPIITLALAYIVLLVLLTMVTPRILAAYPDLARPYRSSFGWLSTLSDNVWTWAPWPPVVGVVALGLFLHWTHRGLANRQPRGVDSRRGLPTPGRVIALGHLSTLLDTLAILLKHRVPLPDALRLSADTTGVSTWRTGAEKLAMRLEAGELPLRTSIVNSGLPPVLACLAARNDSHEHLALWLQHQSARCRRQAEAGLAWHTQMLPLILSIVLGFAVVLPIACLLIAPWADLLLKIIKSE